MFGVPCRETRWTLQLPISWISIGEAFKLLHAALEPKQGVLYGQMIRLVPAAPTAKSSEERTVTTRKRRESQGQEDPSLPSRSKLLRKWHGQTSQEPAPPLIGLAQARDQFARLLFPNMTTTDEQADWLGHAMRQFTRNGAWMQPVSLASQSQATEPSDPPCSGNGEEEQSDKEETLALLWLNRFDAQPLPFIHGLWLWAKELSVHFTGPSLPTDAGTAYESIKSIFKGSSPSDTNGLLFLLLDSGILAGPLHRDTPAMRMAYTKVLVWLTELCLPPEEPASLFESCWQLLQQELDIIVTCQELWQRVLWLQFQREREKNDARAAEILCSLRDMRTCLALAHATIDEHSIGAALARLEEARMLRKAHAAYLAGQDTQCLQLIEGHPANQHSYEWALLHLKTLLRAELDSSTSPRTRLARLLESLRSLSTTARGRLLELATLLVDHFAPLHSACLPELQSAVEALGLLAYWLAESVGTEELEPVCLQFVLQAGTLLVLQQEADGRQAGSSESLTQYVHQEIVAPAWSAWKDRHGEDTLLKASLTRLTRLLLALYARMDEPKTATVDWHSFCEGRHDSEMAELYDFLLAARSACETDAFSAVSRSLLASLVLGGPIEKTAREAFERGFKRLDNEPGMRGHILQAKRAIAQWLDSPVVLNRPLHDALQQASRVLPSPTVLSLTAHVGVAYLVQGLLLLRSASQSSTAAATTKKGRQANTTLHSAIHFLKRSLMHKDSLLSEAPAREAYIWQSLADAYDKWTDVELLKLTRANHASIVRHVRKSYWCLLKAIQLDDCVGAATAPLSAYRRLGASLRSRLGDLVALKLGSQPLCCVRRGEGQRYALFYGYRSGLQREPDREESDWRLLFKRANCARKLCHPDKPETTRACLDMYTKALAAYHEHHRETAKTVSLPPFDLYYRLFTIVYKGYRQGHLPAALVCSLLSLSEASEQKKAQLEDNGNIYRSVFVPFLSHYIGLDKPGYEHRFVYRRCRIYYEDLGERERGLHELAGRLFHHQILGSEALPSTPASSSPDLFNVWKSATERPGLYYYYIEKYTRLLVAWSAQAAQLALLERLKAGLCKSKIQYMNMETIQSEIEAALRAGQSRGLLSE